MLTLEEVFEVAKVFVELGIDKIRLTGGEPLVRKGILELIRNISSLKGVKELAMTTNGTLLKDYAQALRRLAL